MGVFEDAKMTTEEKLKEVRQLLSLKWETKPSGEKLELSEASKNWIINEVSAIVGNVIECCTEFGYRWEIVGLVPYCKKERFMGISCLSTLKPKMECYRKEVAKHGKRL